MQKALLQILTIVISLIVLPYSSLGNQDRVPVAQKGLLDLREWDFSRGKIEMKGEWEFYWDAFHSPDFFTKDSTRTKHYIIAEKVWNKQEIDGSEIPLHGFATYHLRVLLPKQRPPLALKIENIGGAAKYFVNGEEIYEMGKLGNSKEENKPGFRPQVVDFTVDGDEIDFVVQVANFHDIISGIYVPIKLGAETELRRDWRTTMAIVFFLTGSILIMALYHIGLFVLRKEDLSSLYFGFFSLCIAMRAPSNGQFFINEYFDIHWEILKKFDFGGYYFSVAFVILFLNKLFKHEFPAWFTKTVLVISTVFGLSVLVLPYEFYRHTLTIYQLYTLFVGFWGLVALVVASVKKRESAFIFLIGFLIMFSTAVNDILHAMNVIYTAHVVPFGLFFFIFSQAFLLSARFSKSYEKTKTLTKELDKANRELERRVRERTLSLEEANQELGKLSVVADKTDNGVMIMDALGNIEWVNKGFSNNTGYSLKDIYSDYGTNIMDISLHDQIADLIEECRIKRQSVVYESINFKKNGEKIWTQTTMTPIIGEYNEIKNIITVDTDITSQKLAESEIQQQKEEIEAQRDQVTAQRDQIAKQNQRITDSIFYARNIQKAIIPSEEFLKELFADAFVYFRPKDIVSGDFYWAMERGDEIIWAVADCTGHGVPGAFMSSLGITFLNQIVGFENVQTAGEVLTRLREEIKKALKQTESASKSRDGIDMSLCILNRKTFKLQYAGAYNPLWLVRDGKFMTFKGDRMPVGIYHKEKRKFTNQVMQAKPGDALYMFSDGYLDQFYDGQMVKFNSARFKKLIASAQDFKFDGQLSLISRTFDRWKGASVQLDDVLVVGVKL